MKKLIISFLIVIATIIAVWGQDSASVLPKAEWRVSTNGKIERLVNENWEAASVPTSQTFSSLYLHSADFGWAVGKNSTILRWDGEQWSEVLVFANEDLNSVFLLSREEGWAVGNKGTILRWNGISWEEEVVPITENLVRVEAIPTGGVQIFAENGAVLHRFEKNWQVQPAAPLSSVKLSASAKHDE